MHLLGCGVIMKGMKNRSKIVTILLFCLVVAFSFAGAPKVSFAVGSAFARPITIDHTKVPNTDQTNFPVAVSGTYTYLRTTANGGNVENNNGYDIRFYSDSGLTTLLNWETERYISNTGEVVFWVKIPTLSHTVDTVIYMGYGDNTVGSFQGGATGSVWDSNYQSVLHMVNGVTVTGADSTSNAKNATNVGATATTGQIGGGANFSAQRMTMTDINSVGDFTVELWGLYTGANAQFFSFENYPASPRQNLGVSAYCPGCTNKMVFSIHDGAGHGTDDFLTPKTANVYHRYTAKRSGSNAYLYVDGVLYDTIAGVPGVYNFVHMHLGAQYYSGNIQDWLYGKMDEFRISNIARSDDWELTSYNNQSSPSTFYSVGSESIHAPSLTSSAATSITRTDATLNGNITALGDTAPTERGFNYGTTSSYGTTVSTSGSYGTGVYSANITGLTCNTTYHFQAYAINGQGTGSSSPDATFTTSSCPPIASAVSISGILSLGQTITGNYTFGGGDVEGTSTFKWYRDGVEIVGAISNTYLIVSNDQGHNIKFEVTPISTMPETGTPVQSSEVYIYSPQNISPISAIGDSVNGWIPDNNVYAIAVASDGTKYIGGDFEQLTNGTSTVNRQSFAAINPDGTISSFAPLFDGTVLTMAISPDGSKLYVGGTFNLVDSVSRTFLAVFNLSNNQLTTFSPTINGTINTIVISPDGSKLYIGGEFTDIDNGTDYTRNNLASFDITNGSITEFNPMLDTDVMSMAISSDGSTLYAGGTFTSVNNGDFTRNYAAAFNTTTSVATSWNPDLNGEVSSMIISGSTIYVGGDFGIVNQGTTPKDRGYLAAFNLTDGTTTSWDPFVDGRVYSLALSNSILYAGGEFMNINNGIYPRPYLASFNITDGSATDWNPIMSNSVKALAFSPDGNILYIGGLFQGLGDYGTLNYLASYSPASSSSVTTNSATSVYRTSAILNADLTSVGGESTGYGFEYGTTISYGNNIPVNDATSPTIFNYELSSLTCHTTYHYRAYSTNSSGTAYGSDQSFTTGSCSAFPSFPTSMSQLDLIPNGDSADGSMSDNNGSYQKNISSDNRYIVFNSDSTNIVLNDTNLSTDVFVRDTVMNTTTRVSVDSSGVEGDGDSLLGSISSDGRYVTFISNATNLVADDTNGTQDIFVHDNVLGTTTRVSVNSNGDESNDYSTMPTISGDGKYVVFESIATNLVSGDTNGRTDIFIHNIKSGVTTRVSLGNDGNEGNFDSYFSSVSSDGRYVVFYSNSSNFVVNDTNSMEDVFVRDTVDNTTTRVSVSSAGVEAFGSSPSISANGRYVVFASQATNLVSGNNSGFNQIYMHDMQTGATTKVSVDSNGLEGNNFSSSTSISDDGRYVVFHSLSTNLVSGDTNGFMDIFLHDNTTNETVRISIKTDGTESNGESENGSVSPDGTKVAFTSLATNLIDAVVGNGSGNYYLATIAPPDANAIGVSGVHVSPKKDSATITWTTSKIASTKVDYGITSSYGSATSETDKSPRVNSHTAIISDLLTCKLYHFKVTSEDAISQTESSSDMTFKTTGCPTGGGGGGGKKPTISQTLPSSPSPDTKPIDCINGYLFSPSTGIKCPTTTNTSNSKFTRTLRFGSTGEDVLALQVFLNTHGYVIATTGAGSVGHETKTFGKATLSALIKFQKANGLNGDGVMGPKTIEIINILDK